jgi:hypothetical protein
LRDEVLEEARLEVAAVWVLAVDFVAAPECVTDEFADALCVAVELFAAGFLVAGFFAAVEGVDESELEPCWRAVAAGAKVHVKISAQTARCRASRIRGEEKVILKRKSPTN